MGYRNRELEVKLLINLPYKDVKTAIEAYMHREVKDHDYVSGRSTDTYYAIEGRPEDFIRLRQSGSRGTITMKSADKLDIMDRIEIDLEVSDHKQAKQLLKAIHGNHLDSINKKYDVYFFENSDTNISIYQVTGDSRVFIECEARNKKRLNQLIDVVEKIFPDADIKRVKSSLYQMFVIKKEMEVECLELYWVNN